MFNTLANRVISNELYNNDKRYIANERREYRSGFIGGLKGRSGDSDGMTYPKDGKFITVPTDRFKYVPSPADNKFEGSGKVEIAPQGVKFMEADIGGGLAQHGGGLAQHGGGLAQHGGGLSAGKRKGRPKGSKNKGKGMSGGSLGKPNGYGNSDNNRGGSLGNDEDVDIDPVKVEGSGVRYPPIKTGPTQKVTQSYNDAGTLPKNLPAGYTLGKGLSAGKKKGRPKGSKNKKKGGANLAEIREGGAKLKNKVWETVNQALGKKEGGNEYMNEQAKEDGARGAGLSAGKQLNNVKRVMQIRKEKKCTLKAAWQYYRDEKK